MRQIYVIDQIGREKSNKSLSVGETTQGMGEQSTIGENEGLEFKSYNCVIKSQAMGLSKPQKNEMM